MSTQTGPSDQGKKFTTQVKIWAPECASWICPSSDNAEMWKTHGRACAPAVLEEVSQRRKESKTCCRQQSHGGSGAHRLPPMVSFGLISLLTEESLAKDNDSKIPECRACEAPVMGGTWREARETSPEVSVCRIWNLPTYRKVIPFHRCAE